MGLFGILGSLFGTSCSKRSIHTEFIEAKDGKVIAISKLSPEQLPESFAINTMLDMAGKKWSVERAEPQDKADILKAGKVRVYLTAVTMLPTGDILFSLPTISDDLGIVAGDSLPSPNILALHEDDWRQIEFIANKFSTEMEAEFTDIRRIYQEQRDGVGFKNLHVRKRIVNPLNEIDLSLQELETTILPQKKFEAVGFTRTRGTLPGAFAWALDDKCIIWGTTNEINRVTRLCILGTPNQRAEQVSAQFARLTTRYQLCFVDWCRTTKVASDADAFIKYFSNKQ